MERRKRNCAFIAWLFAALFLIGTGCNAFPAFAETIFYDYDDLNRLTTVEIPDAGGVRYEYDEVGNRLSKTFTMSTCVPACPPGFTLEGGTCQQPAGCPGGAMDAHYDLCIHDIQFGCPAGYTYVAERSRCESTPLCSAGSYDATRNRCQRQTNKDCPDGYIYTAARDRCERAPSCPSGGSYSAANNRCEASCTYLYTCSLTGGGGGGWNSGTYGDHDTCLSNCSQTTVCTSGVDPVSGNEVFTCPYGADHACDASHNCTRAGTCSLNTSCSCPPGYSWNGATCTARATCPNGSLNGDNDVCYRSYIPSCDPGWSLGPASGGVICYQNASCPSDVIFNPLYDICYTDSTTGCNIGYTWDPANSLCSMPPQCPAGSSYSAAHKRCEAALLPCP